MSKSKYEFQRNLAVIIGINNYSNGIPRLETAVSDAIEIARILKQDHNYDVRLLKDASLEELVQLLAAFQMQTIPLDQETVSVSENHRVLFYFAGHGIALDALESEDGPAGYLIPHNAHAGIINTYLLMQDLHNALVSLPCRHLLTILDCCFAGAFRWSSIKRDIVPSQTVYKERYERFITDRAWQVITSAAHDQKALDFLARRGTVDQHSPFAAALLTALRGAADTNPPAKNGKPAGDGVITATELYSYLRDELETTTEKLYKRQTPGLFQLSKHDKGEYIFLVPGHELNLPPAPPLNRENNPYRGLEPFDKDHSHLFFGRQEVVKDLSAFVNKQQLTVVLGDSGTGKSSLVKAGLIPDLENAVENQWQVLEPIRPGEFPMTALARASLQMSLGATPEDTASIDAKSQDLQHETNRFALDVATWSNAHPQMKLLLVVDQFEELVTMCRSEQERQQFLQALETALTSNQIYIILTLRSDFEPQFFNSAFPSQWMDARFLLRPMTQNELREVIEKPAAEKVLYFEPPDLVDRLFNEVVQMPGALPLLSFTLSELYLKYLERRGDDRALTESDYFELGGVAGSLTQRATQEYRNLVKLDPAYEHTVRHVMLRMVTVEGGELGRRRVPKSELVYESAEENNRVKTVIEGFSAARLLIEGKEIGDEAYVEPAHDALIRGWDKLQQWKNAQQESLVLRQRLTPAANDWQNQEHNSDYLWSSDPRLAVLEKVLKSPSDSNWLNKLETEFVKQSIQKRYDELEETKERLRISEERRRLAQGRQLAAQSELVRSGGAVQLSVLLAVESMQELLQVDSSVLEADSALRNGLALLPFSTAHHNAVVNNIVFSPDGEYFATASDDKTAKVWEVSSGKEIIRLPHDDQVTDVAFSPDGKYVATASNDKTARLWETSTAREVVRIFHTNTVISITFSPDGKYLATASYTASYDGTAKLWDVNEGKEIAQFPRKSAALVFSPDSRYLITDAGNGAKLWDVQNRREIDHFFHESPNNRLDGIALSPNGKYLATASDNNTIKLWDISSHKEIATLQHRSVVIAFSPDSKYLVTCPSFDYQINVRLWDVKTGTESVHFPMDSLVNKVAFSPDAKYLATASKDNTASIWNIQSREKIADFYHESGVQKISFSPDGNYLATASFSHDSKYHPATASKDIAGVWDATNSKQITRLSQNSDVSNIAFDRDGRYLTIASKENFGVWKVGSNQKITFLPYNAKINSIDLSPDGRYIGTVSEDETVWLWDVNRGKKIVLLTQSSKVKTVKFSPNGNYLATVDQDKVVRVWEANSGKELAHLQGEIAGDSVSSLSLSLDGRYVAVGSWNYQTAEVWEVNSRKRIFRLPRQYKWWITTIALSPDGQYLVIVYPTGGAGKTGNVNLWQTKSDKQTPQPLAHDESDTEGNLTSIIQFSPDGEYFVTAPSTRIPRMWETKSGREVARYPHDFGPVMAIAFSSDNKYVVTASADRTVKIWEPRSGQEIARIPHDSPVNYGSIAFSPDNKYIVTATKDKTVQLSFICPDDLIAESCRRLNRNLSWNEWRLYFGNDLNQYRRTYPSLPIHPSFITEVVKSENIEEAVAILRKLLEQNIPSNIDQTVEARRLVAPDLLKKGEALVTEGKIKEAIDAYTKAEQFDPTLKISVNSWCDLCWYGSIHGYAAEVMDACEKAVTLNPDPAKDGWLRNARGVAKVLTGDTKGAISDFQAAAAWYEAQYQQHYEAQYQHLVGVIKEQADNYKSYKLQRQNWINTLSAGQNPFTEGEIRLNTLER
ncbi:MAG: caspase family protein [Stigonema ocellatum SAG 48.90 = DSM 106950]|nr:caspase family protein [Stigonema ocellatum SAG 48.90 = DSM 106950]